MSQTALTIEQALENGLTLIKRDEWRAHQRRSIKAGITRWMKEKAPQLVLWKDLRPLHVFEFTQWMEQDMRWARHTVNHYMNPLRKAAHWVQLRRPDIWTNIFARKMKRDPEPASDRYLMPDQLAQAVEVARRMNEHAVVAALMFGGLAGLGIMELLDLERDDIAQDGLRVVRAKNAFRPRIIPMCEPLKAYAQSWRQCFARMPIRRDDSISRKARKVLDRTAEETGDETFRMVNLHEATRVTFANNAKAAGAPEPALAAYMGHVGTNTLDRHYLKRIPRHDDLPRIREQKVSLLHAEVVAPLNTKLDEVVFH